MLETKSDKLFDGHFNRDPIDISRSKKLCSTGITAFELLVRANFWVDGNGGAILKRGLVVSVTIGIWTDGEDSMGALEIEAGFHTPDVSWHICKELFILLRKIWTQSKDGELDNVVDHRKEESTTASANTQNDLTGDDHKESHLKDRVCILEDGLVVMS